MRKKGTGYNTRIAFGIAIVLLVVFFWPKTNSMLDDGFTAEAAGKLRFENMVCTCIGIPVYQNSCKSCTQYTDCYGIPVSCQFACQSKINGTWQAISCNKIE